MSAADKIFSVSNERPAYADRGRAESFGAVAEHYERFRPNYPAALIDDLVALRPGEVLDVGCGTGKAARQLVEGGLTVLGVEVDPQMAAVARRHGVNVEIASFEAWPSAGRRFDLITCAQAWHWVDPNVGVPKAARALRPGGTLALFWNRDGLDEQTQTALDRAYRRHAPELLQPVGVVDNMRRLDPRHVDGLTASGLFASIDVRVYPWDCTYIRDDWLGMVQTYSDHIRLDPVHHAGLLTALGAEIDALGGVITSHYRTHAVFARVLG